MTLPHPPRARRADNVARRIGFALALACLAAFLTSCRPAADATDAATPGWVQTELYFSIALEGAENLPQRAAEWEIFIAEEVTPRLPDGLTVLDGIGQWQTANRAAPPRLQSKIIVALHPDTAEHHDRLQAIRDAWLERTGQQSVLRVVTPVDVSF